MHLCSDREEGRKKKDEHLVWRSEWQEDDAYEKKWKK